MALFDKVLAMHLEHWIGCSLVVSGLTQILETRMTPVKCIRTCHRHACQVSRGNGRHGVIVGNGTGTNYADDKNSVKCLSTARRGIQRILDAVEVVMAPDPVERRRGHSAVDRPL